MRPGALARMWAGQADKVARCQVECGWPLCSHPWLEAAGLGLLHAELCPHETVFGDKVLKEVVKFECVLGP